jgi:hypothetical protein
METTSDDKQFLLIKVLRTFIRPGWGMYFPTGRYYIIKKLFQCFSARFMKISFVLWSSRKIVSVIISPCFWKHSQLAMSLSSWIVAFINFLEFYRQLWNNHHSQYYLFPIDSFGSRWNNNLLFPRNRYLTTSTKSSRTTDVHIIALLLLFAPPPKFLTPDRRVNILLHYRGNAKVKYGIWFKDHE